MNKSKSSPSNLPPKSQSSPPKKRRPRIIDPRGDENPLIPYIIRPRRTALRDRQPLLCWNSVASATRYTVSIQTRTGTIWQAQTSETQLVYPGDPPLEPGVEGVLVVETDTGVSSHDEGVVQSIKFRAIAPEIAAQIDAEVERVHQETTGKAQILAVVDVYRNYDLKTEAIDLLEAAIETKTQAAAIYRTLGELYAEVGLNWRAEPLYLRAIALASETEDASEETIAAAGLGNVYEAQGHLEDAIVWLQKAKEGYTRLGDREAVRQVEGKLTELT